MQADLISIIDFHVCPDVLQYYGTLIIQGYYIYEDDGMHVALGEFSMICIRM